MKVLPLEEGKYLLTQVILPFSMIEVGQEWRGSSGIKVTIIKTTPRSNPEGEDRVEYSWETASGTQMHEKSCFAFQCRYCLVVEKHEDIPAQIKSATAGVLARGT